MTTDTLRFIQITDTHLFDRVDGTLYGLNTAQSLTAVVAQVRAREPRIDGILATGDLTHDGGTPSYRRLARLLAPLQAPVYCLPGNHDTLGVFSCALKGPRLQSGGRLVTGGWQVIFLDSAVPGAVHGHLRRGELDRLDRNLQSHPDLHSLICLHHHPLPVGSAWLDRHILDNAEALFATTDHHAHVRGVVWGHVHQAFDATRNGVRLLGSPSSCIQFRPGCTDFTLDDLPPGYRWLELRPDGTLATDVEFLCTQQAAAQQQRTQQTDRRT